MLVGHNRSCAPMLHLDCKKRCSNTKLNRLLRKIKYNTSNYKHYSYAYIEWSHLRSKLQDVQKYSNMRASMEATTSY